MNIKRATLAVAVGSALGLGVVAPVAANVYGVSHLFIEGLSIGISPTALPGTFNFQLTNTATLNGSPVISVASCGGTFGGANNCGGAVPRLDALAANAPAGDVVRANNDFSLFGPGANEYSNSDSVIYTAQLLNPFGETTSTEQIAESELQSGNQASANAQIQSTTGFTFDFDVVANASLFLNFNANPFMRAAISEPLPGAYATQADMSASFRLEKNDGSAFISWAPSGNMLSNNCFALGGPSCTKLADSQNLNTTIGTTTNNTDVNNSPAGLTAFGIRVDDLTDGTWTLTLSALTSTSLTRQPVPEPGVLALLGIGLAGLGVLRRRKLAA